MSTPDKLVDKKAVCEYFDISERTLCSWIKQKKIPYLRLSAKCFRYRIVDVEKALNRYRVNSI